MTAKDTTNRYLKNWETTPKVVKAGLRAWNEHLARERAAEAEAEAEGRRRSRAGALA